MPTTLGTQKKHNFEVSPEAHKLHVEFEVAAGQTVNYTDSVILNADGTVQSAAAGASAETILGVAVHPETAGPGERVTISMKAYTVVWGEASAASLAAGPVELGAFNGTTKLREYTAASTPAKTVGHNITPATLDGEEIKVAILN